MMGWSPDATYQVSRKSIRRFRRRRFLKVFTIYGHGGHLGHVTWTIYKNFRPPFQRMLYMKFDFDWLSGFRGEDILNCVRTTADDDDDGRRTMGIL